MLAKIKARCLNNLKTAKLELAQAMDGEEWFKAVLVELGDVIYQVANLTAELKCADCGLMVETENEMPPEGWEFVDEKEEGGAAYWLCGRCASK